MSEREIIWAVVNTNSVKEADKLGLACLKKRLCACYAIFPRIKSVYYWPPKTSKLQRPGPNFRNFTQALSKNHQTCKIPP